MIYNVKAHETLFSGRSHNSNSLKLLHEVATIHTEMQIFSKNKAKQGDACNCQMLTLLKFLLG